MTPIERRNAFVYAELVNARISLERAAGLVGCEYSCMLNSNDEEGRRLVVEALDAVEKAEGHFDRIVSKQTDYGGKTLPEAWGMTQNGA